MGGLEAQLPTEMEEINVLADLHLDHMTLWVLLSSLLIILTSVQRTTVNEAVQPLKM